MTQPQETGGSEGSGHIILVRHGRPALARTGWVNADGWDAWWAAYNLSGLADGEQPSADLKQAVRDSERILASPLLRAVETARTLAESRPFTTDPVFVEAPLPAPPLPAWLQLPITHWGVVSRVFWCLGYAGGGESQTMANKRAVEAADRLVADAANGQNVLLCAHGWFNRMIRGELVGRGWYCIEDRGDAYWAWRRLLPPS